MAFGMMKQQQQQRPGLGPSFGGQQGQARTPFNKPGPNYRPFPQMGGGPQQQPAPSMPGFGVPRGGGGMQPPPFNPNQQQSLGQMQPGYARPQLPAVAESFGNQQNPEAQQDQQIQQQQNMQNMWQKMMQQSQPRMGGGFGQQFGNQMRQTQPFMRGLGPQQFPIQNQMQRVNRNPVMEEEMQGLGSQMY